MDKFYPPGITNGADWYSIEGSLQDFGYIYKGVMEITLELGCTKSVSADKTNELYGRNREAFIDFML